MTYAIFAGVACAAVLGLAALLLGQSAARSNARARVPDRTAGDIADATARAQAAVDKAAAEQKAAVTQAATGPNRLDAIADEANRATGRKG